MTCGNCNKTDGLCYTSNPPKVKCIVTGKFHEYGDECDLTQLERIKSISGIGTKCLICGEIVEISNHKLPVKVCDKCKAAIRYVRDNFMGE